MPCLSAESTSPGTPVPVTGSTSQTFNMNGLAWAEKCVKAPGHGVKPRTRCQRVRAGRDQSMAPSCLRIFGAWLTPSAGWGTGVIRPKA